MASRLPSNAETLTRTRSYFATLPSKELRRSLRLVARASLRSRGRGGRVVRGVVRRIGGPGAGSREITAARAHLVAFLVGDFYFDAVILSVCDEIGRAVGDGVLIA